MQTAGYNAGDEEAMQRVPGLHSCPKRKSGVYRLPVGAVPSFHVTGPKTTLNLVLSVGASTAPWLLA